MKKTLRSAGLHTSHTPPARSHYGSVIAARRAVVGRPSKNVSPQPTPCLAPFFSPLTLRRRARDEQGGHHNKQRARHVGKLGGKRRGGKRGVVGNSSTHLGEGFLAARS